MSIEMLLMRMFNFLLRLYPPEYRRIFASEMLVVLEASHERCQRKWVPYCRFVIAESFGLLRGAIMEWIVKLSSNSYVGSRNLTDHAVILATELMETQKQVKFILSQMEHAIAHHQFEKARFYSE